MPILPLIHNEVAVPAKSFVQFNGYFVEGMIKPDTYSKWAQRGKLVTTKACKGKEALVVYKTIPEEKKQIVWKYLFDHNREALFELSDVPEGWLKQIFPNYEEKKAEIMAIKKDLEVLSDKELEIAQSRYNLVHYMREYTVSSAQSKGKAMKEFVERYNAGMIHENILKILSKTSDKTLYRWNQLLKDNEEKIEVLAPSYRTSAINRSRINLTEEETKLCKQLWTLANKPTVSSVCRSVIKELESRGLTDICSEHQIRRFINQWAKNNSITALYIREGEKAVRDTLLPHIERDNKKLQFMDMIVADGHTLNFQIKNPKNGMPARATVIMWVDMRTLLILGWEIMLTENTKAVVAALRSAMYNAAKLLGLKDCGIVPKITYTDNGKAFKNKYFKGVEKNGGGWHEQFDGLFNRLKPHGFVKSIYALPYQAQTKVNERIFGTMLEYEKMQLSYVGNKIDNKPARMHRNEKLHKNEYDKAINQQGLPTLQEVYESLGRWIKEYNGRPSTGKYLDGKSPIEELLTCCEEAQSRTIDLDSLHYMMLESKEVNLQKQGIKFMGSWYNSLHLANFERGSEWGLKIRYDLMNLDFIRVYRDNGEFVCIAERMMTGIHPAAEALGSDADKLAYQKAIAQKNEYAKHARQQVREHINEREDDTLTLLAPPQPAVLDMPKEDQEDDYEYVPIANTKTIEEEEYDFHNPDRANPVIDDLLSKMINEDE